MMKSLIKKIDSRISNLNEYNSDSDSSESSSNSSEHRFSNEYELSRKRTMSNKGLIINVPNYLSKLSPTPSINSNEISRLLPDENTDNRGRKLSFSQRLKQNNLLVSNMNNMDDENDDIPIEFKEIIRSRSNSRTRANSMNKDPVGNKSRTTSFGEPMPKSGMLRNSRNTSFTNLKKMTSSLDSIASLKQSTSSLLTASPNSGTVTLKNLKKYLTTGDEMFLTDEMSDEDLFMNNLSHQQLKAKNGDLMVNMTSSANLYSLNDGTIMKEDINETKNPTKVISNNFIDMDYTMPFDISKNKEIDTESLDLNTGLTISNDFSKKIKHNEHTESVTSNTTIKANNLKEYKKITPIDLYGDDDQNNDGGNEWFLGSNK
ncbi:hypothetical protein ACO0R3_002776 [Hanseniaspora guilliermondii]